MMIIDASADALYRSAGSGAWRGRAFWLCLVHRFVNSCTDHIGCKFEYAVPKTQVYRAALRLLELCDQISRQVSCIVISETMY